jgi:predicted TIM-barrel fold metal-dependent hydrolase
VRAVAGRRRLGDPAGGHDPKQRLADMDRQGVERSLLFPTFGLFFAGSSAATCRCAMPRLQRLAARVLLADAQRLLGVAVVPQRDLGEAIAEARRCVRELGFRGVMMRPNPGARALARRSVLGAAARRCSRRRACRSRCTRAPRRTCRSRAATASTTTRCATSARTRTSSRSRARRS